MIDIYAKAGAAILNYYKSADFYPNCEKSQTKLVYKPTITVGLGYDINQNWVTDVFWTRIMVGDIVKSIDFYGFGLSYHFVDVYCGQFLCD